MLDCGIPQPINHGDAERRWLIVLGRHKHTMNAETRRRLAALLSGIAGAFVALSVSLWLRQDACLDAGGRWVAVERACELPAGASQLASPARSYIVGAVAGLLVAGMLLWAFSFIAGRAAARRST